MKTMSRKNQTGWTMIELLVVVALITALAAITIPVVISMKKRAYRASAVEKLSSLGAAFSTYTSEHNGTLPWEDGAGADSWQTVADQDNVEVWYNALPVIMGASPLSELIDSPERLYQDNYPLYLEGAGYPSSDKKLGKPYFAIGMNSRLQRRDEDGAKVQGRMANILQAGRTVAFLERGMPGDKKTMPGQKKFDASPKANARAFVARYNGKGLLVFVDGHVEMFAVSDLITTAGDIIVPQNHVIWTNDPDDDPN